MDEFKETERAYTLAKRLPDDNHFISVKDYFIDEDQVYINKHGDLGIFRGKVIDFVGHYDETNGFEDGGTYYDRTGEDEPDYWSSLAPKKVRISPPKKAAPKKEPLPPVKEEEEEKSKKFVFKKKEAAPEPAPKKFVIKKKSKLELHRPPPLEIPPPRPIASGLNLTGRAPELLMHAKPILPRPPSGPPPEYFKLLYGKHHTL